MDLEPNRAIGVKDLPFFIHYDLQALTGSDVKPDFPTDWKLVTEYRAPNAGAGVRYDAPLAWSGTIRYEAGPNAGLGTVTGWRIENGQGQTVKLFGTKVNVEILGQLLVPKVTIKQLSHAELLELGVIFDGDDYHAIKIEMNVEIKETGEFLNSQLILIQDEATGTYTPVNNPKAKRLTYAPVGMQFEKEDRDRLVGVAGTGQLQSGGPLSQVGRPRWKPPKLNAIVVWPANIGFLNGFFKPTLVLLNVAPKGTNYSVRNLRTTMTYPTDALELIPLESGPQSATMNVLGPGPDGIFGTEDDINTVHPQEQGEVSWVLQAKQPGEHKLDFDVQGTVLAEDGTSHPIRGEAHGAIYVRRPEMRLHFNFPSAVREDDDFDVEAIFTNLNGVPVQDLRFELDGGAIQGAILQGQTPLVNGVPVSGAVNLENKGDEAIFRMHLRSLSTGRVVVHNVTSSEGTSGNNTLTDITYSVNIAVGEHGLPVSTVSLLMPRAFRDGLDAAGFPFDVYNLFKVTAGRALSLADIPPGEIENGFGHVSHNQIRDWIQDLTYVLLKPRMGSLAEQRRAVSRDIFLATLDQPRDLLKFLQTDSKFMQWSQLLAAEAGDLSNLHGDDLITDYRILLTQSYLPEGDIGAITLGDPDVGGYWAGLKLDEDFDVLEYDVPGDDESRSGWFYVGARWGNWRVDNLAAGNLTLVWNGSDMQFLNNGSRVEEQWTYYDSIPPQLSAVRQFGYESVTDPDQVDIFGRQLLLFFSEPVVVDDEFVRNLNIENNWVLSAEQVRDQVIQVWARNPLGFRDRNMNALPGILTVRGEPVTPVEQAIHMSDYWDGISVEGRVFDENGDILPGAEVGLIYTTQRNNNTTAVNFTGKEDLEKLGHGEFAQRVSDIIEEYGQEVQEDVPGAVSYVFQYIGVTDLEGRYEMDNWPLYRRHNLGELPPCQRFAHGPTCVDSIPDHRWTVTHNERRVDRHIFGHYPGQNIIHDFFFPRKGKFMVHIPPLPDGVEPSVENVVHVQLIDQDEVPFDRVMYPGETIEVDGMRYGPVSALAMAIGGFDATSKNLTSFSDGDTIVLDPATQPARITALMLEEDADGVQRPMTRGWLAAYHYATEFGGAQTRPKRIAAVNLAEVVDGQVTMELPEGLVRFEYAFAPQGSQIWQTIPVYAGQTIDLGTFIYREASRGEVKVRVTNSLGELMTNYPVRLRDALGLLLGATDENGEAVFQEVVMGEGIVSVPISARDTIDTTFTISDLNPTTTVDVEVEAPYGLTITVLDDLGNPLTDAWVQVDPDTLRDGFTQSALTDAEGKVRFEWSVPAPEQETNMFIEVVDKKTFRSTIKVFARTPGMYEETTTVTFQSPGDLDLKIVTEDTLLDVPGAWVEIKDASDNQFAQVSDGLGELMFSNLSPGRAVVTIQPPVDMVDTYLVTQYLVTIVSGETREQALRLKPAEQPVPPRVTTILGQVFDANQNPVTRPVKFRLWLRVIPPGEEVPVFIPIGDDHFSTETGGIELREVELPGIFDAYTFVYRAFDKQDEVFSEGMVGWDRRTASPFIPIQMSQMVRAPIRVWDEYGNRMKTGSITLTQKRIYDEFFHEDNTSLILNLGEENFQPEVAFHTGSPAIFTYHSPANPGGVAESVVYYPGEDGRPIDIVVKPLGQLRIRVNDEAGTALTGGVFLQLLKDGRVWNERVLDPDTQDGFMIFDELPYGTWSVLAYQITTGLTDVWIESLHEPSRDAELNLLQGKDFTGTVLTSGGLPVAGAHLILTRNIGNPALSLTRVSGISGQRLLATTDENGDFTFPSLTRGGYSLRVFDPFTNETKTVPFNAPETEHLTVVMRPLGRVTLTALDLDGQPAGGAKVTMYRGGRANLTGTIDGLTGTWTSPWITPGDVSFIVTSISGNEVALQNVELLPDETVTQELYLAPYPHNPSIGFVWSDDGEVLGERVEMSWSWRAPGNTAIIGGKTIFQSGDPLPHRFMNGTLRYSCRLDDTDEHDAFGISGEIELGDDQEILIQIQRPRLLRVKVVDQVTGLPLGNTKIVGHSAQFVNDQGEATFKNVKIGQLYSFSAYTNDGQKRGTNSVVIKQDLITYLTIAMNSRLGNATFTVTQLGDTYSKGFIELSGNGGYYSLLLDGSNQVRFQDLIEGVYRYDYSDPARGIHIRDWVTIDNDQELFEEIQVPGIGPLEFQGEYAGGLPLKDGQIFNLRTQLKTFSAVVEEDADGNQIVRWGGLPEGSWEITTPSIPSSRWRPRARIEHGVINKYNAFGDLALPFWIHGNFTFRDNNGFVVSDFTLSRLRASDGRRMEWRRARGGFINMSLPAGDWIFKAQPVGSPLYVQTATITVNSLDQTVNEEMQLQVPHAALKFATVDIDGKFKTTRVNLYDDITGDYYGYKYASPFLEWDYLPAGTPLEFLILSGSARLSIVDNLLEGYQEWDFITIDVVPPTITDFSVTFNELNLPLLTVTLDKVATSVTFNGKTMIDNGNNTWSFPIEAFSSSYKIGQNRASFVIKGIHQAQRNQVFNWQWLPASPVTLATSDPITSLPLELGFTTDASFEIDPSRLSTATTDLPVSYIKVNGRNVGIAMMDAGVNGVIYRNDLMVWPWKQGINSIEVLLYDIAGAVTGLTTEVEVALPELGSLTLKRMTYDGFNEVTVTGIDPEGGIRTWMTVDTEDFDLTGLDFGFWRFKLENHHPETPRINYIGYNIDSRIAETTYVSWYAPRSTTVRVYGQDGLPLEGVPVTLTQQPRADTSQWWPHGTFTTNALGEAYYEDMFWTKLTAVASFDDYEVAQTFNGAPDLIELQDTGGGKILVRVDNIVDNVTVPDLDVYLDDVLTGQTDANGELLTQTYNAGRVFDLRVEGTTPDGGVVFEEDTVTVLDGGITHVVQATPVWQGTLRITVDEAFNELGGSVLVNGRGYDFPFTQPLEVVLTESTHTLTVRGRLGQTWYTVDQFVTRNTVTDIFLAAPQGGAIARLVIQVTDVDNRPLAEALVVTSGAVLGTTATDGSLTVPIFPGTYSLTATHPDGVGVATATVAAAAEEPVDITALGFNPRSVPGNVLWFDSNDDAFFRESGNAVARWLDFSGNGLHATRTEPQTRPELRVGDLNGRPVPYFNGETWLDIAPGLEDFALGVTLFVVAKPESVRTDSPVVDFGNGWREANIMLARDSIYNRYRYTTYRGISARRASPDHSFRMHEYNLMSVLQTGEDAVLYRDGVELSRGDLFVPTTVERTRSLIAKGSFRAQNFEGTVAEIILFNRALTQGEHDAVAVYLADKYGMYHPEAAWIGNYDAATRDIIHRDHLTEELAEGMVDFQLAGQPLPAEGLQLWLRADAGVTTDVDGRVVTWEDQSYRGNHPTYDTDGSGNPKTPVLAADARGSLPALRFSSADEYFRLAETAPVFNRDTTTFFVLKPTKAPKVLYNVKAPTGDKAVFELAETQRLRERQTRTGLSDQALVDSWVLMGVVNEDNRLMHARIFGEAQEVKNVNFRSDNASNLYLGGRFTGSSVTERFEGDLAEVVIYDRLLNPLELQQVENYFSSKYNLNQEIPEPVFEPYGGVYTSSQNVTIQGGIPGAAIHYTTDGSEPTASSPQIISGGTVPIPTDTVLRARMIVGGKEGLVKTATYVIAPSAAIVVIDRTKTIWTAGTTEQGLENKDIIITGATVTVVGPHQFNSLRLINGAKLIHRTLEVPGIDLHITGDMHIDAASSIDVTGLGHGQEAGPGAGVRGYAGPAGASHGGLGGLGRLWSTVPQPLPVYGDPDAPVDFGSGGAYYSGSTGGKGAGRVKLIVDGGLYVEGSIIADGVAGTRYRNSGAGGGSGGSIFITAGSLHGNGTIHADGGDGYRNLLEVVDTGHGGGGGGRIALTYDSASSTFNTSGLHNRNGLGGFAESGTIRVNGADFAQDAELRIRAINLDTQPMAGLRIRILHTDGRTHEVTTGPLGYADFPALIIGETWDVETSTDGVEWKRNNPVTLDASKNFQVIRVFENAVGIVRINNEFFTDLPTDWTINGDPVAFSLLPEFDGQNWVYFIDVAPSQSNRIRGYLPGFTSVPLIDFTVNLDASGIYNLNPNFGWRKTAPVAHAADGQSLSTTTTTGLELKWVDELNGAEWAAWEGVRNGTGTWKPEGLYLPNNANLQFAYTYSFEGEAIHSGKLSRTNGDVSIPLPFATAVGAIRFDDGRPALGSGLLDIRSGLGEFSLLDKNNGNYRLVQRNPNQLLFDIDLGVRFGFLRGTVSRIPSPTLTLTQDLFYEPHSVLVVPSVPGGEALTAWLHHATDIGEWLTPVNEGYHASSWPQETALQQHEFNPNAPRRFYMPLGYWSVGGDEIASRAGRFTQTGQETTVSWSPGEAPLSTDAYQVRALLPPDRDTVSPGSYTLYAVSQKTSTHFQTVTDPAVGDIVALPQGKASFILVYNQTRFEAAGKQVGKVDPVTVSRLVELELTPADAARGTLDLDFTGATSAALDLGGDHHFDLMPGLIRARGTDGSYHNALAWAEDYILPTNFIFSPLGWFNVTDVTAGGTPGELAWTHHFRDGASILGGAQISLPFSYTQDADPPVRQINAKAGAALGMNDIETSGRLMFGLLTGQDQAWIQPTIGGPETVTVDDDSWRRLNVNLSIPPLFGKDWTLVLPMLAAPYDAGQDTATFAAEWQSFKGSFNPSGSTLWQQLPPAWRNNAVNWNAMPNGITASAALNGKALDLDAGYDRLLIAMGEKGTAMFRIGGGMDPEPLTNILTPGHAEAVAVNDYGTAVIADHEKGLAIVDISSPETTVLRHQVDLGDVRAVAISRDHAYAGLQNGNVIRVDLVTGRAQASIELDTAIHDLAVGDGVIYALSANLLTALEWVDLNLQVAASEPLSGIAPPRGSRFSVQGTLGLVTRTDGYLTIDLTVPADPFQVNHENGQNRSWLHLSDDGLGYAGGIVHVDGTENADAAVMTFNNGVAGSQNISETPGDAQDMALYGGLAYVADGDEGLQVITYLPGDFGVVPPTVSLTTDPAATGTVVTVAEGTDLPITASLGDDIRPEVAELYVNDALYAVDGKLPYRFSYPVPAFGGVDPVLKVKAVDTAGNETWSDPLQISVTQAPLQLLAVSPGPDTRQLQAKQVAMWFNKTLDGSSLATGLVITDHGFDGLFGTADDEPYTTFTTDTRGKTVMINPDGGWMPGGTYTVEALGTIADTSGGTLNSGYSWSFHVEGMLVHMPMDGDYADYSGRGNHGFRFGPQPIEDRNGNRNRALRFRHFEEFMPTTLGVNGSAAGPGATFSMWLKPDAARHGSNEQWAFYTNDNSGGLWGLHTRKGKWRVRHSYTYDETFPIDGNAWQHMAVVFEPGQPLRLYKNGELWTGSVTAAVGGNEKFQLGNSSTNQHSFGGSIDEVRVYRGALSEDDIQTLYRMPDGDTNAMAHRNDILAAYYPFNNASTLDQTINGYDGNIPEPGNTRDLAGDKNKALFFDGADMIATNAKTDQTPETRGVTMSVWVKPTVDSSGIDVILNTDNNWNDWGIYNYRGAWYVHTGASGWAPGAQVDFGMWQHVAAVWKPDTGTTFYKNGQKWVNPEIDYDTNTRPLQIGAKAGLDYAVANIDEVRLYDRPLRDDEIAELYAQKSLPRNDGLVTHHPLDGNLDDISGWGNHLNPSVPVPGEDRNGTPGGALDFSGDDILYPRLYVDKRNTGPGLTLSSWVYPRSTANVENFYIKISTSWTRWGLSSRNDRWGITSDNAFVPSEHTIRKGEWHHLVAVFEPNGNLILYKNGRPQVLGLTEHPNVIEQLTLGPAPGLLDEPRVHRRALSYDEVQALYNLEKGAQPPASLQDELMLYYPDMTTPPPFGFVNDASGQENHGLGQQPTFTEGVDGTPNGALLFDGTDWMRAGFHPNTSDWTSGMTFAGWIYPTRQSGTSHVFSTQQGRSQFWSLVHKEGRFGAWTVQGELFTQFAVDYNQWQFVAAVFEPGVGIHIFKNDEKETLPQFNTSYLSDPPEFGKRGTGNYYSGRLDEVFFYNRPLSDTEVSDIYNLHPITPPSLFAQYKLDGNTLDSGPLGKHGHELEPVRIQNHLGQEGKARYLQRSDHQLLTRYLPDQTNTSPGMTFAVWVLPDTNTTGEVTVVETNVHASDWRLKRVGAHWAVGTGGGHINSRFTVKPHVWQHLAVRLDPVTLDATLWWNGQKQVFEDVIQFSTWTAPLRFGVLNWGLDDAWFYEGVLSDEEVLDLYHGNQPDTSAFLLGHWPLDEHLLDVSGNNWHFNTRKPSSAVGLNGEPGRALWFDTNHVIETEGTQLAQVPNCRGMTVAAWVFPASSGGERSWVVTTTNSTGSWGSEEWGLMRWYFKWYVEDGVNKLNTGVNVDIRTWQHIAATWDPANDQIIFYKNGVPTIVPGNVNFSNVVRDLSIGGPFDAGAGFSGRIQDVQLFQGPLDGAQIMQLYEAGGYSNPDALTAYYPLNGDFQDVSPNRNRGYDNRPEYSTDRYGRNNAAVDLDGVNDAVDLPFILDTSDTGTGGAISLWVRPHTLNTGDHYIYSSDGDQSDWRLLQNGNNWVIQYGATVGNLPVKPNTWQHVVVSWGPEGVYFFRDGEGGRIANYSTSRFLYNARLGARMNRDYFPTRYDGEIDDLYIWQRPLTTAEAAEMFTLGMDAQPSGATLNGLIAYYPFNGDLTDASGAGLHGYLQGPEWITDPADPNRSVFSFDGQQDKVLLSARISNDAVGPGATFALWIYPRGDDLDRWIIGPDNGAQWGIRISRGNWQISGGSSWQSTFPVELNKWQWIAGVWDPVNKKVHFFKDGQQLTLDEGFYFAWNNEPLSLGNNRGNQWFNGLMSDVYIFHRQLSLTELNALFGGGQ